MLKYIDSFKIIFKVLVNEYQWIRISGLIGNFVDMRED